MVEDLEVNLGASGVILRQSYKFSIFSVKFIFAFLYLI